MGMILLSVGCGNKTPITNPELTLQYDAAFGNYYGYTKYDANGTYQVLPIVSTITAASSSVDTVEILYRCKLTDQSGFPSVTISFSKKFNKNQLDSNGGKWITKVDDDFYNLFATGNVDIACYGCNPPREGIDMQFVNSISTYIFQSSASNNLIISPPAYTVASNQFNVTEAKHFDINWDWLYSKHVLTDNFNSRKVLVKLNFKAKLYNTVMPHDSIVITNGIFQGVFADR